MKNYYDDLSSAITDLRNRPVNSMMKKVIRKMVDFKLQENIYAFILNPDISNISAIEKKCRDEGLSIAYIECATDIDGIMNFEYALKIGCLGLHHGIIIESWPKNHEEIMLLAFQKITSDIGNPIIVSKYAFF